MPNKTEVAAATAAEITFDKITSNASLTTEPEAFKRPFIDGAKVLCGGKVTAWTGDVNTVTSPIIDASTGKRIVIGRIAVQDEKSALAAADAAKKAWDNGTGEWPQMSLAERIAAIKRVVEELKLVRQDIVNCLIWEICKTKADAEAEFDRTMVFIQASIQACHDIDTKEGGYITAGGVFARYRRNAVGVMVDSTNSLTYTTQA
jgi:glyceraldehyde-3-phosphate dehydrogenase (NADP+)